MSCDLFIVVFQAKEECLRCATKFIFASHSGTKSFFVKWWQPPLPGTCISFVVLQCYTIVARMEFLFPFLYYSSFPFFCYFSDKPFFPPPSPLFLSSRAWIPKQHYHTPSNHQKQSFYRNKKKHITSLPFSLSSLSFSSVPHHTKNERCSHCLDSLSFTLPLSPLLKCHRRAAENNNNNDKKDIANQGHGQEA